LHDKKIFLHHVSVLILPFDAVEPEALTQGTSFAAASSSGSDDVAACENESMQEMVSVLQDPSIFKSLGWKQPPQCFRPLEPEEYAASFVRLLLQ
jgi:hypothetical protein